MTWNLAIAALATISVLSFLAGFWGGRGETGKEYQGPLRDYLLANQGLERQKVIQLLFSGSFSLNGMLYQAFLGYSIGLWALIVQGAWALSYVLLSRHTTRLREANSLHAFLGTSYGPTTRMLAAGCSIVGFTVLIGWEFNVGRSTFAGLFSLDPDGNWSQSLILTYMIATVFASFLYTAIGGLSGNAFANRLQNWIKLGVFAFMIVLLYQAMMSSPGRPSLSSALLPSFSQVIASLGIFGLITNIAFSLIWQFVDMSTWQNVIASKRKLTTDDAKSALKLGGLAVFLAPGIVGTFLGVFLHGTPGVDGDNVMTKLVQALPYDNPTLLFVIVVALLASIMSMIDGLLLAASYALVCDIVHRTESLEEIDSNEDKANRLLGSIRIFIGIVAVAGTIGVFALTDGLDINLFDIVYFLIVSQLSLTGPVLAALWERKSQDDKMVWAILFGLAVGFGFFWGGKYLNMEWLGTGAGAFTMLASYLVAMMVTKSKES